MRACVLLSLALFVVGCDGKGPGSNDEPGPTEPGEKPPLEAPTAAELALPPAFPSFDEIAAISPAAFAGVVHGIHYGRHAQSPYPFTFITFSNVEIVTNDAKVPVTPQGTLEISVAGGALEDGSIMEIDELPRFEMGEWYLVFLRGGGWKLSPIAGNQRGVFKLHGTLDEDPYVLSLGRTPVAGVEGGNLVFAEPKDQAPAIEGGERERAREERALRPEEVRRLQQLSRQVTDAERDEKEDAERKELEAKSREVTPETVAEDPFLSLWTRAMKLSELQARVRKIRAEKKGVFEGFDELYLVPVPTKRTLEPIAPKMEEK